MKFRRQHPVGRFTADFACVERKLVLELDGAVHERLPERARADVERDRELEAMGWSVLRLPNAAAEDLSAALETIRAALHP